MVENRRYELPTPPLFGARLGVTPLQFCRYFWHQETSHWATIIRRCLRDPTFCCSGTIPACDRQTDGQTNTTTALCLASRGKDSVSSTVLDCDYINAQHILLTVQSRVS